MPKQILKLTAKRNNGDTVGREVTESVDPDNRAALRDLLAGILKADRWDLDRIDEFTMSMRDQSGSLVGTFTP